MAAIAGIVNVESTEDLAPVVGAMCDIQEHRGPHGKGTAALTGGVLGQCAFRFCPPFDAADKIPVVLHDYNAAAVFDGILFNKVALGKELNLDEADAARRPDESILIRCYQRWGHDCVNHLDGIFSFAIWDWDNKILFAARDRLGEKPFYYYHASSGEFIFASQIKALLKTGRVSKELDLEAISIYLYEKAFYSDQTPLKHIHALPPGHCLELRNNSVKVTQYWDIPYIPEKIYEVDYAVSKSRELLLSAIEERMAGIDNPALLLSGGVDSCLLLGLMNAMSPRKITTVTMTSGTGDKQIAMASKLSEQFKTDHLEVELDPYKFGGALADFVWYCSLPTVGSILPFFASQEMQKRNITVAFHGHMADNTFDAEWLPGLFMPIEEKLTFLKVIPESLRVGIYGLGEKSLRTTLHNRPKGFLRHLTLLYLYFRRKRGLSKWYNSGLMPEEISRFFNPAISQKEWRHPADIFRELYHKSGSGKMAERSTYAAQKAGSGPSALLNYESVAAAHSIQMQAPFQDQQLIEFSRALSHEVKGTDGIGKYITRRLCSEFTSRESAEQKKAAFILPYRDWFCTDMWPIMENALSRESIERRGIFQYDRINELCSRYRSGDPTLSGADISAPVILEIWMRTHCDPLPADLSKPSGDWLLELLDKQ
jgi:asparagine synthase (glutamine-hydrolysing)